MTRDDFQQLADVRIAEAKALLDAGFADGAYYLAGYAVECALKACIAKLTNQYDFPPKNARDYYTHSIKDLVVLAGLKALCDAEAAVNSQFKAYWATVKDWSESSRYERNGQAKAQELYDAITDPANGVLPWIKQRW